MNKQEDFIRDWIKKNSNPDNNKVDPVLVNRRKELDIPIPKLELILSDTKSKELKQAYESDRKFKEAANVAYSISDNLKDVASVGLSILIPEVGLALGAADITKSIVNKDYLGGGIQAGLELAPYVGKVSSKIVSKLLKPHKSSLVFKHLTKPLNGSLGPGDKYYTTLELENSVNKTIEYYHNPIVVNKAAAMGMKGLWTELPEIFKTEGDVYKYISKGNFKKAPSALGYTSIPDAGHATVSINPRLLKSKVDPIDVTLKHEINHVVRVGNNGEGLEPIRLFVLSNVDVKDIDTAKLSKLFSKLFPDHTKELIEKRVNYMISPDELPVHFSMISLRRAAEGLDPYGWASMEEFVSDLDKYKRKDLKAIFDSFKDKKKAYEGIKAVLLTTVPVTTSTKLLNNDNR